MVLVLCVITLATSVSHAILTAIQVNLGWPVDTWFSSLQWILDILTEQAKTLEPPHKVWSRSFYRPDTLPLTQPTVSKHWSHLTLL